MKKIAVVLMALAVVVGCKNKKKTTNGTVETVTEIVVPVDMHNAQTSLDYDGTYKGTIPCADCLGIEMTISIDREGNFERTIKYLGKGDGNEFKDSGKYKWDATGRMIEFQNPEDPGMYFVSENRLIVLDLDGRVITGELADNYVLTKQVVE